ncbi:methyl-accepting chemotaxis protein [Paenibacillus sp. FSL A5-0031]|uniref:methyl-accepting chemotaxis protein n=1 Tax=Paenibacillus sp. FSL A5-0031 TaxID=1920420 RepID=UPI00096D496B|nr:methyl-accepting chemotaxis protein [Paenibacillus sp. FSL A5-0031]OME87199.1 methyl-accepting chemotaxis protein [Paenibacillus sp. FSL A5-0031]
MFDWLGMKVGFPLWVSWQLNKDMKTDVEQSFEGIAETRKELLTAWAMEYWNYIDQLGGQLTELLAQNKDFSTSTEQSQIERLFERTYARAIDITELFLLDVKQTVISSTHSPHIGTIYQEDSSLQLGLSFTKQLSSPRRCLFGPYSDSLTLKLGARSSSFHDKMTLLFMLPITLNGSFAGTLCARVPNDVLGDLIQRESGHVYPDSGDNYIFMAKAGLNTHIAPGTALSRSRFEDRTFTHGENLKDGVTTDWGKVSIKEHTELEIVFNDPATGQLHPGVANTIASDSNLFVEYPGYSDYRHISVIGKGVTFQLPHCPDKWGMMCEGDLEEVYRIRSIGWRQRKQQLISITSVSILSALLMLFIAVHAPIWVTATAAGLFNLVFGLLFSFTFQNRESKRVVSHLRQINRFIRINAEGKGDLTQRLQLNHFDNDESKELAKWINNMIDSLEGIMLQVKLASSDVLSSQYVLNESAAVTSASTERVSGKVSDMIGSIRLQLKDIDMAKDAAGDMQATLKQIEEQAAGQIEVAKAEVDRIGEKMLHISAKVGETNGTIHKFMDTVQEIQGVLHVIEEISAQTNLLALNASIEAARVGEQGRGFAVVASEIRKLADMTKKSTEEVHEITRHIYDEAKQAYASMDEGTRVVEEGNQLVAAAASTLASAHAEDHRKTQVVDEVVQLMEKIALVSRENRKISSDVESKVQELIGEMTNVRQTSQSVESITTLLQQLVGQFKLTESRIR